MKNRVLIAEDEKPISDIIKFNLEKEGYEVITAYDGEDALKKALNEQLELIILDIMLPSIDGFEICKKVREKSSVPIIMVTAKEEEVDKILGLELGADDYITKPFSTRELISRIKAVLRRTDAGMGKESMQAGNLTINTASQRVMADGEDVVMSSTEYRLLCFFVTHAERAYTRAQILDAVWGGNVYIDERTVDVHIRRLRKLLAPFGADTLIQTVRGTGYRFSDQR